MLRGLVSVTLLFLNVAIGQSVFDVSLDPYLRDLTGHVSWDPQEMAEEIPREHAEVVAEGEELTITFHGAAQEVVVCCGIQAPLHHLEGSDVWVLRVRIPDLPRAVLGLHLSILREDGTIFSLPVAGGVWRGPDAPPAAPWATELRGAVRTVELASEALGAARAVTTYLPPTDLVGPPSFVIYAADGETAASLAHVLEPAMVQGCIDPFLVVGPHSLDGQERWEEYTPARNPEAFAAHAEFFSREVVTWAERELGAPSDPSRRVLYGVSNGADFVLELSRRQGDRFASVVAFSPGYPFGRDEWMTTFAPCDRYYLSGGTLEPRFHARAEDAATLLKELGVEARFHSRVAGHDAILWREEAVHAVHWLFGTNAGGEGACLASTRGP